MSTWPAADWRRYRSVRQALLMKFGSVRGIREAPVDEIAATVGFTTALAERVKAQV